MSRAIFLAGEHRPSDGRFEVPTDRPLPITDALAALSDPSTEDGPLADWLAPAKLALDQVAEGKLLPALRDLGDGVALAHWRLADWDPARFPALPAEEVAAFGEAVADLCGRVEQLYGDRYLEALTGPDGRVETSGARLVLELRTPGEHQDWQLDFAVRLGKTVPAERAWQGQEQQTLVRGLAEAARLFPPIDRSLSEQRPTGVRLDVTEAADLLAGGAAALTGAGIDVRLPSELTEHRLRARARVTDLTAVRWEAAIGEETLSTAELKELAGQQARLVRWRDRWVWADGAGRLAGLLDRADDLPAAEALSLALAGTRDTTEFGAVEVVAEGAVEDLVRRLQAADAQEPRLDGVDARLRDYQRRGAAWLQSMAELGFGTLLADDMGLGKTLQAIALLADRPGPHLVVCPTSVLGNWARELNRFAPGLEVRTHHGAMRPSTVDDLAPGTVLLTSYPLLRIDAELLDQVGWDVVVLDEAQQIKNPDSQAARAARGLRAEARLALTGTPVENRLSELWSIMRFCNPGLLGSQRRFRERFVQPIERQRDPAAARQLRAITAPFLLRRLKSEVASDLPAKQEAVVSCTLTDEQAALYRTTVRRMLSGDLGTGIQRRGRVLRLLTALKQICNHPAQYLGDFGDGGELAGRSGKLARTTEMLAEVVDEGERALLFTQYRVMGELLATHLAAELELAEVPFLHGGLSTSRRDGLVRAFQQDERASPLLIVSLKAGGVGLNLTRATHVLHYDRWWNPAVEDQATDRAHRIGQTRTVFVHKLVTGGTLEERIADLLESKRGLADAVIGSGEDWLTELADEDLRALVELTEVDR
ncbi:DEAD/DEAH box helicase [Amycolatopsis nigrescens]|uniref:DEAD/DEAH box helicase n=1 Tax=Amycolatopsis nigrescens TaxID=381445 RepID=UPI00037F812C|nr:DEAD/DEAH box helicase [Amycolatopsis nigrescens]